MEILYTKEFWYFFIPVLSGFLIYFLSINKKAEKKHLLILFRSNQSSSKRIQRKLKEFIEEFNASNAIAYPERNLTYGTLLEVMYEEYKSNLSDECYESVKKLKISKPTLLSMTNSLDRQCESLRLLEIDINLVIKKSREGRI